MSNVPCMNPKKCGVQTHRRETDAECMKERGQMVTSTKFGDAKIQAPSTYEASFVEITPATALVLDATRRAGGKPILVGGCVRDALLTEMTGQQFDSKDVDIEVYGVDEAKMADELAKIPGVHLMQDGTALGVYKVSIEGEDFDVSLPRIDSKTGPGHKGFSVEINSNLTYHEAFGRRDFTIGSMGVDPTTGELIDPYNGQADLEAEILRHTSDAFDDDPLRVMRGIRFASRFGFDIAPETLELSRNISDRFGEISRDRVWKEFYKITSKSEHISKGLQALVDTGWIKHFPSLDQTRGVPQDATWHPEGDVFTHLGLSGDSAVQIAIRDGLSDKERSNLVLAAISHDFGKVTHTFIKKRTDGSVKKISSNGHAEAGVEPAKQFLKDVGAPHDVGNQIIPLVREHMCHSPNGDGTNISDTAVRRLVRRLNHSNGGPSLQDWARLVEADKSGRGLDAKTGVANGNVWIEIADRLGGEKFVSDLLLKGSYLISLGIKASPSFQFVVAQGVEAQDEGVFLDEAGAIKWFDENRAEIMTKAEADSQKMLDDYAREKREKGEALKEQNRLIKLKNHFERGLINESEFVSRGGVL